MIQQRHAFFALVLLLLAGCVETVTPPPRTADYYLQEGDAFLADERYEDAIASWQKVRDNFYSPESNAFAEYKIAEAHFLAEQYPEAAVAYEAYLKQRPDDPRSAEVLYRLGLSYYRQILSPDRDQTATHNTVSTFETLLKRFPADAHKDEILEIQAFCRQQFAAHELYVGRFYLRTDKFDAAIGRLAPIPATYPEFVGMDEVYFHLGKAYLKRGDKTSAAETFNRLFKEFPASRNVLKAQKLLEKEF